MIMCNRRQQTRWGVESTASTLTGLALSIAGPMANEKIEAYILHVRIEEIIRSSGLMTSSLLTGTADPRLPNHYMTPLAGASTPRYYRHREKLEHERHTLVQQAARVVSGYRAPQWYHYNHTAIGEKINIPEKDEPLHCLTTAGCQESIKEARKLVKAVIKTAITAPEHVNQRKREQLRDLARANGTFRDDEGRHGWRDLIMTTNTNSRAEVTCRVCDDGGHIAKDCPSRRVKTAAAPWRNENPSLLGAEKC
ncbi:hypothetical protein F4779DRAFT_637588 [Xylariaceae sp. FL0662B]|nr:hypothetical protein F4779DRAFT_637588 [Xylariaceae sp. FL0662B]